MSKLRKGILGRFGGKGLNATAISENPGMAGEISQKSVEIDVNKVDVAQKSRSQDLIGECLPASARVGGLTS